MNDIAPEAYLDALVITHDAPTSVAPMSVVEMHLFSYLGCIIALFRGRPVGDWGYGYAITSEGFPFSRELEDARRTMVGGGLVEEDVRGHLYARSHELSAELETVMSLGPWQDRRPLLRAATQCALTLPIGSIRHAINQSPGIGTSLRLGQRRRLLEDGDVELLYGEYAIVASALGGAANELLSPAVLWLSARVLRAENSHVN